MAEAGCPISRLKPGAGAPVICADKDTEKTEDTEKNTENKNTATARSSNPVPGFLAVLLCVLLCVLCILCVLIASASLSRPPAASPARSGFARRRRFCQPTRTSSAPDLRASVDCPGPPAGWFADAAPVARATPAKQVDIR